MPTPEQVPLTLRESAELRLQRMPVSQEVKEALKPGVKLTADHLKDRTDILPANKREKVQFTFAEGESLNQKMAMELYGKGYGEITDDQRYFLVTLEVILKQQNVNASAFNPGDQIQFNFKDGTFTKMPKGMELGDETKGELKLEAPTAVTDKTRAQTEALLRQLEKEGILYEAMRAYGDDASFAGRVKYLEENIEMPVLLNHYYGSETITDSPLNNRGYKGTEKQNVAYLKAYLAFKRHQELGVPYPEAVRADLELFEEESEEEVREPVPPPEEVPPPEVREPGEPEAFEEPEEEAPPITRHPEAEETTRYNEHLSDEVTDEEVRKILEWMEGREDIPLQQQLAYLEDVMEDTTKQVRNLTLIDLATPEKRRRVRNLRTVTLEMEKWHDELVKKVSEDTNLPKTTKDAYLERLTKVDEQIDYCKTYVMKFKGPREEEAPVAEEPKPTLSVEEIKKLEQLPAERQVDALVMVVDALNAELNQTYPTSLFTKKGREKLRNMRTLTVEMRRWYNELVPKVSDEPSKAKLADVDQKLKKAEGTVIMLFKGREEREAAPKASEKPEEAVKRAANALGIPEDIQPLGMGMSALEYQNNTIPTAANALMELHPDFLKEVPSTRKLGKPDESGSASYYVEFEAPDRTPFIIKAEATVDPELVKNYCEAQRAAGTECNEESVRNYAASYHLWTEVVEQVRELTSKVEKAYNKREEDREARAEGPNESEETAAEITRLTGEMRRLAQRNAWTGVEANYKALLTLTAPDALPAKTHKMGAEAARALGDASETYSRLILAKAAAEKAGEPTQEIVDWMNDMNENYGRVEIKVDRKYKGELNLVTGVPPFAPDQRAALATAAAELAENRSFSGLLPVGTYSVGDQTFTVTKGGTEGEPITVTLEKTKAPKREPEEPEEPVEPPAPVEPAPPAPEVRGELFTKEQYVEMYQRRLRDLEEDLWYKRLDVPATGGTRYAHPTKFDSWDFTSDLRGKLDPTIPEDKTTLEQLDKIREFQGRVSTLMDDVGSLEAQVGFYANGTTTNPVELLKLCDQLEASLKAAQAELAPYKELGTEAYSMLLSERQRAFVNDFFTARNLLLTTVGDQRDMVNDMTP